jgi:hypothetical protein
MKNSLIATGAVLALSLVTAPVALASDKPTCSEAKALVVTAQTRFDNRAAEERVDELKELDAAKVARNAAQVVVDKAKADLDAKPDDATLKAALKTAQDALAAAKDRADRAQKAVDTDSTRLAELRTLLKVAIQDKDKACDDGKDDNDGDDNDDDGDDDKTPTTTVFLQPPDVHVDVHNDVATPRGGVNTGGGPA